MSQAAHSTGWTRRRIVLVASVLVLLAALGAVGGLYAWVRAYTPLDVFGDGPGHGVVATREPALGSGGRRVFLVRDRSDHVAEAHFSLTNVGRWPITIESVVVPPHTLYGPSVYPVALRRQAGQRRYRGYDIPTAPFTPTRLGHHQLLELFVRYRLNCSHAAHDTSSSNATLELRYRYLGHFVRTQTLQLPAALTLVC